MSDTLSPSWGLMGLEATFRPISSVFQELPTFKSQLEFFDPIKSSTIIAGLLTDPSFHANTLRIEFLIHLFMAFAMGNRRPSSSDLNSMLNNALGSTFIVNMEDPVEDVFISNVTTKDGNIRIFEGIWESNDFNLQRMLNIVETLPENPDTNKLKHEIHAILLLSEEIAARLHLERFCKGSGIDKGSIRVPSASKLKLLRQAIAFSHDDLKRLRITTIELETFTFKPYLRNQLKEQTFGDNELIRRPIVQDDENYFILLPAAISVAIRQYVLEWMLSRGYQDSFDNHLVMEYQDLLHETPILGLPLPEKIALPTKKVDRKIFFEVSREIDKGRYLHLLVIVDGIEGYQNYGFFSPDSDMAEIANQLKLRINSSRDHFRQIDGFKQGLTLIIGCGYGRPNIFYALKESTDWWVEFVAAPDLQTLAWLPGESPLILWKLIEHKHFMAEKSVSFINANGLLNLYGWWVNSDYLMLHPEIKFPGSPINIVIPTDGLTDIRRKVRQGWDLHALPLPTGKFTRVRRKSADSYFPGETGKYQFVAIEAVQSGSFLMALKGGKYIWWLSAEHEKSKLSRDLLFQAWDAVSNWLEHAVPVFERYVQPLNSDAFLIILDFNNANQEQGKPISESALRSCIVVSSDQETKTIRLALSDPFFAGFHDPKNIAERTLLWALIIGTLGLAKRTTDEKTIDALIREIIPDDDARYFHIFEVTDFLDYIQYYDHPKKLFIDDADVARSKMGLGWLVQNKADDYRYNTAIESVKFLNSVVDSIWRRMQKCLHNLDRENFIKQALWHLEGAEAEKRRWRKTIRAVLAIRDDKESSKNVAMQQIARCNASEIALRLVVEMAVSECPLKGGKAVGKIDLTPLMSDVSIIFHFGGCSDAIKKGVMEPEIEITPWGDVLTHIGFRDDIEFPMGKHFEYTRLNHEAEQYEKNYKIISPVLSVKGKLADTFLEAFETEFNFSIDTLRSVRETLENLAIEKKLCVFTADKNEILSACANDGLTTPENALKVIDAFTLWPRSSWENTPKGFDKSDWYPWRFGRQLSLLRRPLVCLEEGENPRYVISPELFGTGIALTISRYFEAEVDISKCTSKSMKRWIVDETYRRSCVFEKEVFLKIQNMGYTARLREKVTALVNAKLDQDYGDIDVLAWRPENTDLLVIECKDLKSAKTPNEIAEQLNRFTGQLLPNGERDNLLKHIDRCKVLAARYKEVAKMIDFKENKINIRCVICFSKPVPMQYVASRFPNILFVTIDNIKDILFSLDSGVGPS